MSQPLIKQGLTVRQKVSSALLSLCTLLYLFTPAGRGYAAGTDVIGTDIYDGDTSVETINQAMLKVIKIVGGFGGLAFTLAVMVITIMIIFGSISSQKKGQYWTALISCIIGAFIFFSAYLFAPAIAQLAGATS